MVEVWEILPDGSEVLLNQIAAEGEVVATTAEVISVVFAPEIAGGLGLAYLAKKIWEIYGDRIREHAREWTQYEMQRMKTAIRKRMYPYGDPDDIADPDSFNPKVPLIEFKKTKPHRKRQRNDVDANDELDQKMDEAENPPPAQAQTVIPKMTKWTSYPQTTTCVDLGTMNLDPKGGRNGDRWASDDITGKWTEMRNMYGYTYSTGTDHKLIDFLTDCRIQMRNTNSVGATMGSDGDSQVHLFRVDYLKTGVTSNYRNCSFNSAMTLAEILGDMPIDRNGNVIAFAYPVPDGTTYQDEFFETNDATGTLFCIRNQFIELHFKNISGTAAVFNEEFDQTTELPTTESPLKMTVRVIKAKKDIPITIGDTEDFYSEGGAYSGALVTGWTKHQDRSRTDDPLKPLASLHQRYDFHYGDNQYLMEDWDVVDKKEFCLCVGQEGTLRIGLPKPQILSMQYLLNARKYLLVSGTPGASAVWLMRTPFIKKGEQHVIIEMHGGVGYGVTAGATPTANIKAAGVAVFWTHSYEYNTLVTQNSQITFNTTQTKAKSTDYSLDPVGLDLEV